MAIQQKLNPDLESELVLWAEKAVKILNQVSENTDTLYYQQSPLSKIKEPVDSLIIGINPGSYSPGVSKLTPEQFLEGNLYWENRFERMEEGSMVTKDWKDFFGNAHYFICQDYKCHSLGFDRDSKNVWTNLTPFATKSKNYLKNIQYKESIPFLVKLIDILKPKQIYFLGTRISDLLGRYAEINSIQLIQDTQQGGIIEIGTCNHYPYIQLPHPSRKWGFNHFFIPSVVSIWQQLVEKNYTLNQTAETIKHEINQWLRRLRVIE